MIDHAGLHVRDIEKSKEFYRKTLASLGYELMMDFGPEITGSVAAAGFGRDGKPDFWISEYKSGDIPSSHLAFGVDDSSKVDAFYQAGLDAGAKDNGAPGLRPQYHPNYYGAFLLDPDGHNIEAVFHGP